MWARGPSLDPMSLHPTRITARRHRREKGSEIDQYPTIQAIIAGLSPEEAEDVYEIILDALAGKYGRVDGAIQDRFDDAIDVSYDLVDEQRKQP